ncbi:MAG TPA: alpha/beta fold hydrolase [Dongiaceae bacterium]|jgi:3-oxoadipate enol-lactonase|nr:alpha/beta fold hydrolase [Dongiaceae bacterium]
MPDIRIDDTNFHYRLDGSEDRPLVVLSHALSVSHAMWGFQLPLLAQHYRVLSYDMRGHGGTDATGQDLTRGYTLEQMADDVANLASKLGHSRFHFVGLSIGGMIGQVLALRHRKLLDRLVLCCAGTGKPNADQQKMWDDRVDAITRGGVQSQLEGTLGRWFSPEFRAAAPHAVGWIADLIRATESAGYIGAALAIKRMDVPAAELETLRLPTLCIAGEKDPGATVAAVGTLRDRIQGARLAVIKGGYHLCNVEKPHDFNEALLGFLLEGDAD